MNSVDEFAFESGNTILHGEFNKKKPFTTMMKIINLGRNGPDNHLRSLHVFDNRILFEYNILLHHP